MGLFTALTHARASRAAVANVAPPSLRLRLAIALGGAAAAMAWLGPMEWLQPRMVTDFDAVYVGARALLHGADPFSSYYRPITYPLPAMLFAMPLAMMPIRLARLFFVGLSSGLLAWALSRKPDARLFVFASAAWFVAIEDAQWSPLILAAAAMPALAWVLPTKPNIGLAVGAGTEPRSIKRVLALALILPVLSFVFAPSWFSAWRAATAHYDVFLPLVTRPYGALLLLAAARWRRPEARILLVLALVPLNPALYEAVLVFCGPLRAIEGAALATLSWFVEAVGRPVTADYATYASRNAPAFARGTLFCAYLPALLIVLLRPNQGNVPGWLERRLVRAPRWLRGWAAEDLPARLIG